MESPHKLFEATELLSCRRIWQDDGKGNRTPKWLYGNFETSNAWNDIVPSGWELMARVPAYGEFWDDLLASHFPEDVLDGPFIIELQVEYRSANGTDQEVLDVLMELNEVAKGFTEVNSENVQTALKAAYGGSEKFFGRVTSSPGGETTHVRWFVVKSLEIKELVYE